MLPVPRKAAIVVGKGEGDTLLTSFDKALLDAGIGNYNLLKVSSIFPPHAEVVKEIHVPEGVLLPTAYGTISSSKVGETITAAVAIGVPEDQSNVGVIMEFSGNCSEEEAEKIVRNMVKESFEMRGYVLKEVFSGSVSHVVKKNGSVIAAAVMWY